MPTLPDVIAFDLVGTLFSTASLEPHLAAAGGDSSTLALWLARLNADGFALTAAGDYRSFRDVARASLRAVLPQAHAGAVDGAVGALAELEPYPDSEVALGRAVLGTRAVVLTNASAKTACALMERAGLDAFAEAVVSVEDIGVWKPAAVAYRRAAELADVPPERMAMVSSHPWDVHGARQAGLGSGWCNRSGGRFPATFRAADVEGADLVAVVEALLALPGP